MARPLLAQKALELQPLSEPVDPVIGGNVLLPHSEAMSTLGIHVKFGGFVGRRPLLIERNAFGREPERIVSRGGDKHGRRISRHGCIMEQAPVDRSYKSGLSLRRVLEG